MKNIKFEKCGGENHKMNKSKIFPISLVALAVMASFEASASVKADKLAFFNKPPKAAPLVEDVKADLIINNLNVKAVNDGSTEFVVGFNGFALTPTAEKIDNKLILNFGNVDLGLVKNVAHPVTKQFKSFDVLKSADGHAQLVIELADYGRFTTRKQGSDLILKIYPSVEKSAVSVEANTQQGVKAVNVTRTKGGEDQAIVDLLSPSTPVVIKQEGSKILVRFKDNKLPQSAIKKQTFSDTKAIIGSYKSYNEGRDGVLELTTNSDSEYMAIQVDNKLTINVAKKHIKKSDGPQSGAKYTGRKISMDFQNVDTRRVLQLIANYTETNIVASDNISGNISLRLKDVPWDQALTIIQKTKGLTQRKDGNVIWVAPIDEVNRLENEEARALAQSIKLSPLVTRFVQLNYAVAEDVARLIRMEDVTTNSSGELSTNRSVMMSRLNANGDDSQILSPRGSVTFDARTNKVFVNDTPEKVDQILKIIDQLDVPVKQVMVEARIVRANTNFSKAIGVKWGAAKAGSQAVASDLDSLYANSKYGQAHSEVEASDSNVNLDLGQTIGTSSIAFGIINTTERLLALELSALQTDGKGEVISEPKVMTGDKQKATIRSGVKLPYRTISEEGANTTFQEAVLELTVTPSITPDGTVQMNLVINKDTQGQLTDAGYAIDTNQLNTSVLVKDGETVVLGGLFENNKTQAIDKVPFLGDIPGIGKLFKSKSNIENKQELLIFITPKVIDQKQ